MSTEWAVASFRLVEGGVLVSGVFGADERVLFFPVTRAVGSITVVSRPKELQAAPVPPGGSEQAVLEAIRVFFNVSLNVARSEY